MERACRSQRLSLAFRALRNRLSKPHMAKSKNKKPSRRIPKKSAKKTTDVDEAPAQKRKAGRRS